MGCGRRAELMRLPAVDNATQAVQMSGWERTLVIMNALDAPVFLAYKQSPAPSAAAGYDVVCPGAAMLTVPIPDDANIRFLSAQVDYPGAVPAGDAGLLVIVLATEDVLPAGVGPLA